MSDTPVKLPRHTKGKRPHFFDDPAIDQMMTFLIALTTELSVLRDRVDTLERLLDAKGTLSREAIEEYQPDAAAEKARAIGRDALIKRVFRMHHERKEA